MLRDTLNPAKEIIDNRGSNPLHISNRYQPKANPRNSFFKMQIFICQNALFYGHECTEKCASIVQ